jgi:hypothetical protein
MIKQIGKRGIAIIVACTVAVGAGLGGFLGWWFSGGAGWRSGILDVFAAAKFMPALEEVLPESAGGVSVSNNATGASMDTAGVGVIGRAAAETDKTYTLDAGDISPLTSSRTEMSSLVEEYENIEGMIEQLKEIAIQRAGNEIAAEENVWGEKTNGYDGTYWWQKIEIGEDYKTLYYAALHPARPETEGKEIPSMYSETKVTIYENGTCEIFEKNTEPDTGNISLMYSNYVKGEKYILYEAAHNDIAGDHLRYAEFTQEGTTRVGKIFRMDDNYDDEEAELRRKEISFNIFSGDDQEMLAYIYVDKDILLPPDQSFPEGHNDRAGIIGFVAVKDGILLSYYSEKGPNTHDVAFSRFGVDALAFDKFSSVGVIERLHDLPLWAELGAKLFDASEITMDGEPPMAAENSILVNTTIRIIIENPLLAGPVMGSGYMTNPNEYYVKIIFEATDAIELFEQYKDIWGYTGDFDYDTHIENLGTLEDLGEPFGGHTIEEIGALTDVKLENLNIPDWAAQIIAFIGGKGTGFDYAA